jgi:hypothetical protein
VPRNPAQTSSANTLVAMRSNEATTMEKKDKHLGSVLENIEDVLRRVEPFGHSIHIFFDV